MKKIITLIIIKLLLQPCCFAQNHYTAEFKIPEKKTVIMSSQPVTSLIDQYLTRTVFTEEPAKMPLFVFNDQPVLVPVKPAKKTMMFFTELSFSDVLENSINNIRAGIINTYDDHITELFKDAPSLIKVKFIISL
jgi:hypothetical protein